MQFSNEFDRKKYANSDTYLVTLSLDKFIQFIKLFSNYSRKKNKQRWRHGYSGKH